MASFDRRGDHIYTGNARGKVNGFMFVQLKLTDHKQHIQGKIYSALFVTNWYCNLVADESSKRANSIYLFERPARAVALEICGPQVIVIKGSLNLSQTFKYRKLLVFTSVRFQIPTKWVLGIHELLPPHPPPP